MRTHKDLIVWQKAMDLVKLVYKITRKLPKSETFGLISQTQRSAVSIPSNISEGAKREHTLEYLHFLSIANGSSAELETQLILIQDLYPQFKETVTETINLLEEIQKMIYALMKSLKN